MLHCCLRIRGLLGPCLRRRIQRDNTHSIDQLVRAAPRQPHVGTSHVQGIHRRAT